MRYFRVGKDSLTPLLFISTLLVVACSSQDPSFKEDITTKTRQLDREGEASGDAIGVSNNGEGRTTTDGVQDFTSEDDAGQDLANGDGQGEGDDLVSADGDDSTYTQPIVLLDGKDIIDPTILEGEENLTLGKTAETFDAAQILTGEKSVAIDQPRSDTFTLTRAYHEASKNFTQITRMDLMDAFQQGVSGNSVSEDFTQTAQTGVLDVLIVIDNSGSMYQEQNNLSTKLQPLLSYVQGSDWRIGVVTTDYNNGCMRDVIRKTDVNFEQKFANAIQAGTSGSGNEMGIRMAVEGLKGECLSEPWMRANSTVAVLIVSDEDNCSNNGSGCNGTAWASEDYLIDHLASIRTVGDDARVYGLFWHPTATCNTASYRAHIYAAAVEQTSGTWGTICDANYTSTLQAISQNIGTILKHQFVLNHAPDAGTTTVHVNGVIMSSGWNIAGTVITFDQAPMEGSTISVGYSYGATDIFDTFTLSAPASSDGLEVRVNNAVVATSQYSFDAGQNAIVFNTTPAENASIQVDFKEKVTFLNEFSIGTEAVTDSVAVKINNTDIPDSQFSYDQTTGKVSISPSPIESAGIVISYTEIGDPILAYPYTPEQGQTTLLVVDTATGNEVLAAFDNQSSSITIDPTHFVEGMKIRVTDPLAAPASFVETWYDTGAELVPASAFLDIGEQSCADIDYSETSLGIERCDLTGLMADEGTLTYKFVTDRQHRFSIDSAFFEQVHAYQIWRVYVDGELFTEFILDGYTVEISDDLEADSEIKIEVTLLKGM